MQAQEVEQFCQYLRIRNYSDHTLASYQLDLKLFFAEAQNEFVDLVQQHTSVYHLRCKRIEEIIRRHDRAHGFIRQACNCIVNDAQL